MYVRYLNKNGVNVLQQWRSVQYMNAAQYYSITVEGWFDVPVSNEDIPEGMSDQIYLTGDEFDIKFASDEGYQAHLAIMAEINI